MYTDHQLRNFKTSLFRTSNTRPFVRATGNRTTISFTSLHSCAEFMGVDAETLWGAFVRQEPVKGWMLSYIPFNDREAVYAKTYAGTVRPKNERLSNQKRPVKILDLKTDEIKQFDSVRKAGDVMGINNKNILASISTKNKVRLLYERYVVIDEAESFDFLTKNKRLLLLERIPLGIVVLDTENDIVQQYSSLSYYLRRHLEMPEAYASLQRHLRLKKIIAINNRYYIVRLTPNLAKLDTTELRYHIQKMKRERDI